MTAENIPRYKLIELQMRQRFMALRGISFTWEKAAVSDASKLLENSNYFYLDDSDILYLAILSQDIKNTQAQ